MSSASQKYRSSIRDQVRIVTPTDAAHKELKPGSIIYGSRAPHLSKMLEEAKALNRSELGKAFGNDYLAVVDALDALQSIAAFHSWTSEGWIDAVPHPAHQVLFSCFHKTLLSIHTANELTFDGLYGMARPHLRQAFESMVIAKFCAADPDSDIFDKWVD